MPPEVQAATFTWLPAVNVVAAIVVAVVLPLLAYIQRSKDKQIEALEIDVKDLTRKTGEHEVAMAELKAGVKTWQLVHEELSEIRRTISTNMVNRAEWEGWTSRMEADMRELKRRPTPTPMSR